MCIGPQYKVNRLLDRLNGQRKLIQHKLGLKKTSAQQKLKLGATLITLDWCIAEIRQHADRTRRVA